MDLTTAPTRFADPWGLFFCYCVSTLTPCPQSAEAGEGSAPSGGIAAAPLATQIAFTSLAATPISFQQKALTRRAELAPYRAYIATASLWRPALQAAF